MQIGDSSDPFTALGLVPKGKRARIVEIQGGQKVTRRLLGLGLRVGSEVEVLHHRGHGVVVASAGNRIALGGGVADKLLMQLLEDAQPPG
jgi:ferrous iron transport protein A